VPPRCFDQRTDVCERFPDLCRGEGVSTRRAGIGIGRPEVRGEGRICMNIRIYVYIYLSIFLSISFSLSLARSLSIYIYVYIHLHIYTRIRIGRPEVRGEGRMHRYL